MERRPKIRYLGCSRVAEEICGSFAFSMPLNPKCSCFVYPGSHFGEFVKQISSYLAFKALVEVKSVFLERQSTEAGILGNYSENIPVLEAGQRDFGSKVLLSSVSGLFLGFCTTDTNPSLSPGHNKLLLHFANLTACKVLGHWTPGHFGQCY